MQASRPASPRFLRDLTDFASLMRSQQHRPRSFDRLEKVIRDWIKAGAFNDISPKLVAELTDGGGGLIGLSTQAGLNLPES